MTQETYGRSDTLPPIGPIAPGSAEESKVVEQVYARRQGVVNSLALPLALAKQCRKIAAWGEDIDTPDESFTVVHKIRQAIETQVSSHLKEPVKATIEPVESGEYAKFYWSGPPEAVQDLAEMGIPIDPIYVGGTSPMGQNFPPQPLPMQLVMAIKQASEQQPDIVNPDYICKLDDQYVAKTLQRKLGSDWKEIKADKWVRSRVYANTIEGWQLPFIEYDPKKGLILNRNSIFQTYIAQDVEDIDDAVEAGIDLYLDLYEAIAKYPQQKAAILASNVTTSGQVSPPQAQGKVPTQYHGTFRRPMVTKLVWWLANQPVSEQLAVQLGLVQQVQNDIGHSDMALAAGAATDLGNGQTVQPSGMDDINPTPTGDGLPANQVDEQSTGEATPAGAGGSSGYVLPNGTPVTPDSPEWPTALAQISIIGNAVVEYIICPWPVIPIAHMRNTMIIGKPWGVGEPFYAKKLQDAYSQITDSAVKHTEYNANPAMEMLQSLKDSMEAEYGRAFVDPGRMIGVPDSKWIDGKPLIRPVMPPPFPDSSLKIRQAIGEDFNQISGRPDVLAGNTPTANASGELVAQLQNAAAEPLNFKAQEITYMVEKVVELWLYATAHFEDPAKIAEQLSMPLPLLLLVMQRVIQRPPNVQITVSTGAGSVLERKRAQYVQWHGMRDPETNEPLVSAQSTQEMLGLDPEVENRRNEEAKRRLMAMQAPQGPPPPSESINYADLPPAGQVQMAAHGGIKLSPQDIMADQQQKQVQKQQEMQQRAKQNSNGNGHAPRFSE